MQKHRNILQVLCEFELIDLNFVGNYHLNFGDLLATMEFVKKKIWDTFILREKTQKLWKGGGRKKKRQIAPEDNKTMYWPVAQLIKVSQIPIEAKVLCSKTFKL